MKGPPTRSSRHVRRAAIALALAMVVAQGARAASSPHTVSCPRANVPAGQRAGHCRNILDPNFRLLGVGVVPRPVRGYASGPATWTEDFALGAGQRPASNSWGPANRCPY